MIVLRRTYTKKVVYSNDSFIHCRVFMFVFFFSVFEKDQLTTLCKKTISKLGSNFENISGLGWGPEKSRNFSDDVV